MGNFAYDTLEFQDDTYVIKNSRLLELPKPEDFGVVPHCSPALWGGYFNHYVIQNNKLYFKALTLESRDGFRHILGITPVPHKLGIPQATYHNLNIVIEQDIKLLVGRPYRGLATIAPYDYRILKGLHFQQGRLVEEIDYSKEAKQLRRNFWWRKRFFKLSRIDEYRIMSKLIPINDYGYERVLSYLIDQQTN